MSQYASHRQSLVLLCHNPSSRSFNGLCDPMMMRLAGKGDFIHSADDAQTFRGLLFESPQWSNASERMATCWRGDA